MADRRRTKTKAGRSASNAERNAVKTGGATAAKPPKKPAKARKGGKMPKVTDPDFFSVHMRRLGVNATACAIYENAPKVGADGLAHLQGLACQAQYQIGRAYKALVLAIEATPESETVGFSYGRHVKATPTWKAEAVFAATQAYASAMKRMLDASTVVNRLWLDNELDALVSKLDVKTDSWREAMAAYVEQVAQIAGSDPSVTH